MNVCLQDTPVILIQTPDKNNNEEKKCMFQTCLWGVGTSLCFIQKGAPKGGVSCFYSFGEPLRTWTYAMLMYSLPRHFTV